VVVDAERIAKMVARRVSAVDMVVRCVSVWSGGVIGCVGVIGCGVVYMFHQSRHLVRVQIGILG
jgi:hypothetical protein